jgi:hypothetical protein
MWQHTQKGLLSAGAILGTERTYTAGGHGKWLCSMMESMNIMTILLGKTLRVSMLRLTIWAITIWRQATIKMPLQDTTLHSKRRIVEGLKQRGMCNRSLKVAVQGSI